jgi:AcrR family transcriptional regulator
VKTAVAQTGPRRLAEVTDAAAKVFARRGYHGASTQDIADVLGIRQASLYYYFDSKEAALEAVCANGVEDYAVRAQTVFRSSKGSSEKVAQLVFHHLAPMAERLDYTVVFRRMAGLALLGLGNSAALWFGREPGVKLERITQSYLDLLVRAFRVRH